MIFKRTNIPASVLSETKTEYLDSIDSKSKLLCTAPYTGLYFTPDGTIRPCCAFNNMHNFGIYPQTDIKTALKSANRKKLQSFIKNDNLNFGCKNCLSNIQNGNYRASISSLYNKYKPGKYPKVIDFELSHFCNLDCEMCVLHTSEQKTNEIYGSRFLEEIKSYLIHAEATRFYGGEPFLIKIYQDLWDMIVEFNPKCHVHIQTNASVFNDKIKKLLNKLDVFIGISLDALTPELYEKIRKGAKFDVVMSNIRAFNDIMQSQGKSLSISFCPMPENWQELIPVVKFAESIGSKIFFNTVNYPSQYSLKFLHSSKLKQIRDSIKQNFDLNINEFVINKQEITNFISGIDKLILKQIEIEKEFSEISVAQFCSDLEIITNNKKLISDLLKLINEVGIISEISPYIIADIQQYSKENIISLLTGIVENRDYIYIKNLLKIPKE